MDRPNPYQPPPEVDETPETEVLSYFERRGMEIQRAYRLRLMQRALLFLWGAIFGFGILSLNLGGAAPPRPQLNQAFLAALIDFSSLAAAMTTLAGLLFVFGGSAGFLWHLWHYLRERQQKQATS